MSFNLLWFPTVLALGAMALPATALAECPEGDVLCADQSEPHEASCDEDGNSDGSCDDDEPVSERDDCGSGLKSCGGTLCIPLDHECCPLRGKAAYSCAPGLYCKLGGCAPIVVEPPPADDQPEVDGGVPSDAPDSPDGRSWSGERPDGHGAWSGEVPEGADLPDGVTPDMLERAMAGRDTFEQDGYTCSSESLGVCDVTFCMKPDRSSCYYESNGEQVMCDDCSSDEAIETCGYTAARECIDLVEMLGCSAAGTGANTNAGWMGLTLAGLFIRRSRRSRRSPRAR